MTAEIYTSSDKSRAYFTDVLFDCGVEVSDGENGDLCIVDAPLTEQLGEFGNSFAAACAGRAVTVFIVKRERYEQFAAQLEPFGVVVIAKPFQPQTFRAVVLAVRATVNRVGNLKMQLEELRIIDRAKLILISTLKLTEQQAHKHIERQAMNRRVTKRDIALDILKTYDT